MYLTSQCGSANGYFPINTKWGATSTLSGILPGGGLRGASTSQPWRSLGYFRPNQAMSRGMIPGLGDDQTEGGIFLIGGIAAGLAYAFYSDRKKYKRRRG